MKIKQIHTNTQRIYAYTRKKEQKQIYGIPRLIFSMYLYFVLSSFVFVLFLYVCVLYCARFLRLGVVVLRFTGSGVWV